MEIISITGGQDSDLASLFSLFDAEVAARGVKFAYGRFRGDSAALKRAVHGAGFYYAESSYRICHRKVASTGKLDRMIRRGLALAPAQEQHHAAIRDILASDFDHGRIHEDPWVERATAARRYRDWLPDLLLQRHEVYVYLLRDEVIGLHIQRRTGAVADLVLTGVKRSHSLLGVSLWAEVMRMLRDQSVAEAHTLISAANIPIMNLYRSFEFDFEEFLCGFHKRY